MGRTYREFLNEKLKDSAFKKEWDELEPEYQLIKAMLKARDEQNITQSQLSDLTGIAQADINKMESGEADPTLNTMKQIAQGLGLKFGLMFTPMKRI